MRYFCKLIETIFPDDDYHSMCTIVIILAFIIYLGIVASYNVITW